jgi:hypothetical protein
MKKPLTAISPGIIVLVNNPGGVEGGTAKSMANELQFRKLRAWRNVEKLPKITALATARSLLPRFNAAFLKRSLLIAYVLSNTSFHAIGAKGESDAQKFKKFIESPPIISKIVYSHYYPGRTNLSPPTFVLARFQPGCFFKLTTTNATEALDPLASTGPWGARIECQYHDLFWNLKGPNRQLVFWDRSATPDGMENNPLSSTVMHSLRNFSHYLHMGVQHAEIGSIRWVGDAFKLTNVVDGSEWRLTGNLVANDQGRAQELNLELILREKQFTATRTGYWSIVYGYDSSLSLPFLPSKITTYWQESTNSKVLDEYAIFEIETSNAPLPEKAFDWTGYVKSNSQIYFVSNRSIGHVVDGKWSERWKQGDPRILSNTAPKFKPIYFAFVGLLFAPLLWAWKKGAIVKSIQAKKSKTVKQKL